MTKAIIIEFALCATRTKNTYFLPILNVFPQEEERRALVPIALEMLKVAVHMLKDGMVDFEVDKNNMDERRK